MSGEEDFESESLSPLSPESPMVIDIGSHGNSETDEEAEDSFDERQSRQSGTIHAKKNGLKLGRNQVDMTPPNELLERAQRNAQIFRKRSKTDRCVKELIACTALTRIVFGENHWKVASSYADLAEAYYELKGYTSQAIDHSETAKAIMLAGLHVSGSPGDKADIYAILVKIYYTMARSYIDLKRYSDGEQALNKARKSASELKRLPSTNSTKTNNLEIKLCLEFSRLYEKQKKIAAAQAQCEMAAELTEKLHGHDSPKLIPIYVNLTSLEQKKGRVANRDRVIELSLQAHSVAAANYKAGSVEMVDTAMAVADAYVYLNDPDAYGSAESYYNECLTVCTSTLGPKHEKSIKVQDQIARLFISTNRYQEALSILKTNLRYKCELYGEFSDHVAETHSLIGSIHLAQGQIDKCLVSYNKCYEMQCLIFGSNHKKCKETQSNIDILKASSSTVGKAVLSKQDELNSRPRFNTVVKVSH